MQWKTPFAPSRLGQLSNFRCIQWPLRLQKLDRKVWGSRSLLTVGKDPRLHKHSISTLDRARLSPSDFLDLSSKMARTIYVADMLGRVETQYRPLKLMYETLKRFPAAVQGFLYYHAPHPNLPTAGEVRFRVTPSADPTAWMSGQDLMRSDGMPWSYPVLFLAQADHEKVKMHAQSYAGVWNLLKRDKFVSRTALHQCNEIIDASPLSFHSSSRFMHSFEQLFPIKFENSYLSPYMVSGSQVIQLRIRDLFHQRAMHGAPVSPYNGSALCRFEKSTLPEHRVQGTRRIVMRIVKIIQPAETSLSRYEIVVPEPKEGGLVTMYGGHPGTTRIWSLNVSSTKLDSPLRAMYSALDRQ